MYLFLQNVLIIYYVWLETVGSVAKYTNVLDHDPHYLANTYLPCNIMKPDGNYNIKY